MYVRITSVKTKLSLSRKFKLKRPITPLFFSCFGPEYQCGRK
jgi:hypothetical protein